MIRTIISTLGFIVILSGCLTPSVNDSLEITHFEHKIKGIVVLAIDPEDDYLAECIRERLEKKLDNLLCMDGEVFRNDLYPWFEPGTTPKSISELSVTLSKAMVREKINSLGVDILICLTGETLTREDYRTGGGGGGAAILVGGVYRETDIFISIWNLTDLNYAGSLDVEFKGTAHYGIIGILPYFIPARTETASCKETADRLSTWLIEFVSSENN
jgi:hypothetical protein